MTCSERDLCIKCEKGGQLLICSDGGCPIAVHEKCMACPVRLDDKGKFYCPFCLYRQAVTESHHAKEIAMSKKKALLAFIDGELMDCNEWRNQTGEAEGDINTKLGARENVEESNCDDIEIRLEKCDVSNNSMRVEVDKEAEFGLPNKTLSPFVCGRDDVSCEGLQQFPGVRVPERSEELLTQQDGSLNFQRETMPPQENCNLCGSHIVQGETTESAKFDVETQEGNWIGDKNMQQHEKETSASSSKDDSMLDDHLFKRRDSVVASQIKHIKKNGKDKALRSIADCTRRMLRVKENACLVKKADAPSKLRKLEDSTNKSPSKLFPRGRRKKLIWTEEEEDMLEEGVRAFKSRANKNIPWRKILEFGHHIFHSTRTPEDLKDKWQRIGKRG